MTPPPDVPAGGWLENIPQLLRAEDVNTKGRVRRWRTRRQVVG